MPKWRHTDVPLKCVGILIRAVAEIQGVAQSKGQSLGFFVAVDAPARARIESIETAPDFSNVRPRLTLKWIEASEAKLPPSASQSKPTLVVFENESRQNVLIFGVDNNGRPSRAPYGRLAPSKTRRQETGSGHVWLVTDEKKRALGYFVAAEQPAYTPDRSEALRVARPEAVVLESNKAESKAWRKEHKWSPNQLRHTTATEIRSKFGLEGAQVALGHSNANVTEIYAERDMQKAADIMRQVR